MSLAVAQEAGPVVRQDTLPPTATPDSLTLDSSALLLRGVRISNDSLDAPVIYQASDSMRTDVLGKRIHLYGNAEVNYLDITLKAAHIILDWDRTIIEAEPLRDSSGQVVGLPEFQDGTQQFTADRMRYNYETRRGIVYDPTTEQEDIIVRGGRSKFLSGVQRDSTSEAEDVIYSEGAIFTTCTAEEPHFGIRTRRAKVVPNKVAVVGPSNLEIMGVPTPLWLPFGFFPISSGRSTGLLFPRDYEYSPTWGFGLRNIGWYFPLGDHVNLTVTGNIYLRGTWGLAINSQYRRRYKYNGNLRISYDRLRRESAEGFVSFDPGFAVNWSHRQDQAAHPTSNFGGSINFQTNSIQQQVFNDFETVSRNTINSNVSYTKAFPNAPISLSMGLSHNQNNQSGEVNVQFPNLNFQTQTIFPFRRKVQSGGERWYEAINFSYRNNLVGSFQGTDSTFFQARTLENARFGLQQNVNLGTNFKILRYINLNPSIVYREVWYNKRLNRDFESEPIEIDEDSGDTTLFGRVTERFVNNFNTFRTYSAGVSLNTQIFGTLRFKGDGWLRGLRHVIKPNISLGFQPDYLDPNLGYRDSLDVALASADPVQYLRFTGLSDDTTVTSIGGLIDFSPFEQLPFGAPPNTGRQMAISYSLNNIFEAKVFSKKNEEERNIKLFDNIIFGGSYNFEADSLKWSTISGSANTRFFKGVTTLNLRATFDPYERAFDENGILRRLSSRTTLSESGVPFKLTDFSGTISTNLTVGKIRALFQGEEEEVVEDAQAQRQQQRNQRLPEETDFLSLFENFSLRHNLNFQYQALNQQTKSDTLIFRANSIEVRGSIRLTDNWDINVGSIGYDFVSKRITYPFLTFRRDLHCWEINFSWAPQRNFYSFSIGVKPGTLDFLKVPYTRNNVDGSRLN